MTFIPMLQFQGNCAAAMARYAEIFEADDLTLLRYFEGPEEANLPRSDHVMKAEMKVAGSILRGMDFPPGLVGDPQAAVAINWQVPDMQEGQRIYNLLAKDGWPILPFGTSAWAKGFGLLRDPFGTHWMIICDLEI